MTGSGLSVAPHHMTATDLAAAVANGKLTVEAIVRSCLERIEEREPEVQAWHFLDPELVLAEARALDKRGVRGPLAGVPLGVKDIIDTVDMPTEYGSPIHRGHRPGRDASCVALARNAGALVMGKTVTTEFANFFPGKTRNPHDSTRTPGGSSSGSAAAVADFMVPLAYGTQTTASTIRPAAFCGILGYRPTYRDISCSGVLEASGSLDTVGLFGRSLDDVALFRDVLLGIDPVPVPAISPPPRIGFCRSPVWPQVEPLTQMLIEAAVAVLAAPGAPVREVTLPAEFDRLFDAHRWISSFEFTRHLAWEMEHHWDAISETLRNGRIKDGLSCSLERYHEARDFAGRCREALDAIFEDYDVLVTPAVTGEAPVGLASTGNAAPCAIWTAMHVPAISLPVLQGPNGLPVGLQLVARRNRDRELFAAARWVMRALS